MIRYNDPVVGGVDEVGPINVNGGGAMSPSLINPKILTGIGIMMGPVILDIPISYYFFRQGAGLSIGISLGIVY
jgi:hypothetical protein